MYLYLWETGRSCPDIDTREKISETLEVELTWLLYGKPVPKDETEKRKATLVLVGGSAVLHISTRVLSAYTKKMMLAHIRKAGFHVLVRLILVPLDMIVLGAAILQLIDFLMGIKRPQNGVQKVGRVTTVCAAGVILFFVLPIIIFYASSLPSLPVIPVYHQISGFFFNMTYSSSWVYLFLGMAAWLFCPLKNPARPSEDDPLKP